MTALPRSVLQDEPRGGVGGHDVLRGGVCTAYVRQLLPAIERYFIKSYMYLAIPPPNLQNFEITRKDTRHVGFLSINAQVSFLPYTHTPSLMHT